MFKLITSSEVKSLIRVPFAFNKDFMYILVQVFVSLLILFFVVYFFKYTINGTMY